MTYREPDQLTALRAELDRAQQALNRTKQELATVKSDAEKRRSSVLFRGDRGVMDWVRPTLAGTGMAAAATFVASIFNPDLRAWLLPVASFAALVFVYVFWRALPREGDL